MPTRSRFIDVAKGANILFVAFGHSHLIYVHPWIGSFNQSLLLFRMPFFFFLSGIFFEETKTFWRTLGEKTDALLKPYAATLLLVLLKRAWFEEASLRELGPRVLYGIGETLGDPWTPLWYLPHLWLLSLFCLWLTRTTGFAGQRRALQGGLLALLLAGGTASIQYWGSHPIYPPGRLAPFAGLPFSLDLVLLSAAFFLLGRALRTETLRFRPRLRWAGALLALFLLVKCGLAPRLDFNLRIYAQPLAATVCALAGIYLALTACHLLDRIPMLGRLLSAIGSLSLFILLFHAGIERLAYDWLPGQLGYGPGKFASLLAYALSIGLPALLGLLIQRNDWVALFYLPLRRNRTLAAIRWRDHLPAFASRSLPMRGASSRRL